MQWLNGRASNYQSQSPPVQQLLASTIVVGCYPVRQVLSCGNLGFQRPPEWEFRVTHMPGEVYHEEHKDWIKLDEKDPDKWTLMLRSYIEAYYIFLPPQKTPGIDQLPRHYVYY
ncbi:BA75_03534T0 [Komagataella pastoris]|uniref:BA75_03534T0 n=1 Tax=Komagataella pastoris TaxID=4922 RepID=A0A1B2JGB8_PICPA|nr:BA75_03534T0 [Komagataella pastoris]